ncbi:M20/M25/M40 family metallo-hydrolase [Candidatus Bathyarchaeota archaeon]|nr:M20/M25/M40 family metallo-hydrolase [Candidatus Bathyarchaeota archaeon]
MERVESDGEEIIDFLQGLIKKKSSNPPGDTREAISYVSKFLEEREIEHRILRPDKEKPNIVSKIEFEKPGRNLTLNGHVDVFPVSDTEAWKHDPWSGVLENGRIYGRGACDMKAGVTALVYTFIILSELSEKLSGSITLTVVSDEETGGRLGSGWLIENIPEVRGDCCINAEPSSPHTIRFGEKGILWFKVSIHAPGAHGAYTHLSSNPIKIAAKIISDLENLKNLPVKHPKTLAETLKEGRQEAEIALGSGGFNVMSNISVNFGVINGGIKKQHDT